jgi:hypothetical protein
LIVYRKSSQLRLRRAAAPEPPWWYATAVAPYGARRATPLSIDYLDLTAAAVERQEVAVCETIREELDRARLQWPVLIEATEFAETMFRRGEEATKICRERGLPSIHLISTRGELPADVGATTVAVAAWPFELERLDRLFASARERGARWGVAVPVIFPVTTHLEGLRQIVHLARGASFLAAINVELDATAKQAIARSLTLPGDDETYAMLFHSDLDPLHVATERHIAALAAEAGMSDFVVPPDWPERTNWNAAVLLTLTAARMIAMQHEVELAGSLARAGRRVAELEKPLARIAAAAPLSIIGALDEISVDILSEWLDGGRSAFVDRINERWRLRRDYRSSGVEPSPLS